MVPFDAYGLMIAQRRAPRVGGGVEAAPCGPVTPDYGFDRSERDSISFLSRDGAHTSEHPAMACRSVQRRICESQR
jgi:hypothetical protein